MTQRLMQSSDSLKFTTAVFLGGLLLGEGVQISNDGPKISSNDELDVNAEATPQGQVHSTSKTVKHKGKDKLTNAEATQQYVDKKVQTYETRLLKAIPASERRLLKVIEKMKDQRRAQGLGSAPSNQSVPPVEGCGESKERLQMLHKKKWQTLGKNLLKTYKI